MLRELIKTTEIKYSNKNGDQEALLEYYILEYGTDEEKIYGIEVGKKSNNSFENEIVKGVSGSKKATLEIIDVLSKNEVTPVSFIYILDDIQE